MRRNMKKESNQIHTQKKKTARNVTTTSRRKATKRLRATLQDRTNEARQKRKCRDEGQRPKFQEALLGKKMFCSWHPSSRDNFVLLRVSTVNNRPLASRIGTRARRLDETNLWRLPNREDDSGIPNHRNWSLLSVCGSTRAHLYSQLPGKLKNFLPRNINVHQGFTFSDYLQRNSMSEHTNAALKRKSNMQSCKPWKKRPDGVIKKRNRDTRCHPTCLVYQIVNYSTLVDQPKHTNRAGKKKGIQKYSDLLGEKQGNLRQEVPSCRTCHREVCYIFLTNELTHDWYKTSERKVSQA